ncbi:MAG: rhodanese-like domain-containing protein [Chthonomonas sp.]|nr:rhodanese-like domain-containing protein [Chthonomonas sp.]
MKQHISIQELSERIDRDATVRLVDVRSPGEFAAGHVPGAVNVPLEELGTRLVDLGTGPIALLCQSGQRAGIACEQLANFGKELMLVEGGTKAWIQAGKPVVATTRTRWSLERQVRLVAGLLVLVGTLLAALGQTGWIYLAMFVGAGLSFAGITDICGMGILLAKLPWNRKALARS